jgi:hypothetical protein
LTTPLERFLGPAQVSFARLIFFFVAIFHGTACGFHLVATWNKENEESWLDSQDLTDARVATRYFFHILYTALSCKCHESIQTATCMTDASHLHRSQFCGMA